MTQTIKDPSETINSGKVGDAPRSNPVCLEVGVTIRSLPNETEAPAKTIREDVRTVIVFDNGAVLRCSENLPVGQKFILSNASGRDVVCRVGGGRNLPTIKGYVEVQFIESVNDFWDIHQSPDPVIAAAPAAASSAPRETPVAPPPPAHSAAPLDALPKPASMPLGSAPTFDDIGGLISVPISTSARDSKSGPARSNTETTTRSASTYNQSQIASPTSIANWNLPDSGAISETRANSSQASSSPMAVSQTNFSTSSSAPTRDFMSKGLMAYEKPGSSSSESNGRIPLIVGAAAIALLGVGVGVFMMRRSSPPVSVARVDAVGQQSPAERPAEKSSNESAQASQETTPQAAMPAQPSAQPVAVEEPQPVAAVAPIPAVVTNPVATDAKTESRNVQRQGKNTADSRKPNAPAPQRPAITNLKMSAPSVPHQKVADLSAGSSPLAEIAASEPVAGSTPAGLLTSSGRTSNPPAPPSSAPVVASPVAATKIVRDPKLISSSRLAYPTAAKQANVQGTVKVSASIDAKGNVVSAEALSGPLLLRQAAVDSVKQWKYSPAQEDGKPVPTQVTVGVDFRLN